MLEVCTIADDNFLARWIAVFRVFFSSSFVSATDFPLGQFAIAKIHEDIRRQCAPVPHRRDRFCHDASLDNQPQNVLFAHSCSTFY